MALIDIVREVSSNLKEGRFVNEAAVETGVILTVLNQLGWSVLDPNIVAPKISIPVKTTGGDRRVPDYTLKNPNGQNLVFFEVKSPGSSVGDAQFQLFEQAFHGGVPFAVLTNGQEWHFYLPTETGSYDERLVYKMDLLQHDHEECCQYLERYLLRDNVWSGKNVSNAREDLVAVSRRDKIVATMPIAWAEILKDHDNSLSMILADQVETLCGFKPDLDTCGEFLANISPSVANQSTRSPVPVDTGKPLEPQTEGQIYFVLQGKTHTFQTARAMMKGLFEELYRSDPTQEFLSRFAARKHGTKRRYIDRDRYALYPGQPPEFHERYSFELDVDDGSWWMSTNWGKRAYDDTIAELALEIAGLKREVDIVVNFG